MRTVLRRLTHSAPADSTASPPATSITTSLRANTLAAMFPAAVRSGSSAAKIVVTATSVPTSPPSHTAHDTSNTREISPLMPADSTRNPHAVYNRPPLAHDVAPMASAPTSQRPLRVLAVPCDDFACGQWRVIQPFTSLADPRVAVAFPGPQGQVDLGSIDVAVFQRTLWPQQLPILRQLKAAGKKLVLDYDDAFPLTDPALPDYPMYAPGSPNAKALEEALALADAVIVSTPELAAHYAPLHRRVALCPNAIDLGGPLYRPGPFNRVSDKLTLFWSGWTSHGPNLQLIVEPVLRILRERTDTVFALCGPPDFLPLFDSPDLRGTGKVIHIPPVPFATFMRVASIADVALAPLALTGFNDAKSEIRLLEPAAWGVPAVASPSAAYRRFAGEGGGENALLADANRADAWHAAITHLLNDTPARRALGTRARTAVAEHYNLHTVNRTRIDLLLSL